MWNMESPENYRKRNVKTIVLFMDLRCDVRKADNKAGWSMHAVEERRDGEEEKAKEEYEESMR